MESNAPFTQPSQPPRSKGKALGAIGLLILAGLLVAGVMPRLKQEKNLADESADVNMSAREVNVTSPRLTTADALELPGNVRALEETQLFARTNGYLVQRYVDIGSRVKAGDVLAVIQSPDVDQQRLQAVADQAKAVASVGQSEADVRNKQASVTETEAEVARSRASVEQSKAALAGSRSKVLQSKAAQASSVAKLAQAKKALDTQKAALRTAEAQRDLADATVKRYRELLAQGFVAQQDADQAEATLKTSSASVDSAKSSIGAAEADVDAAAQDVESAKAVVQASEADVNSSKANIVAAQAAVASTRANVSAAQANVGASQANVTASVAQVNSSRANTDRYTVLQGFSKVIAPFDGVITLRNADVGSLVAPGDASNPRLALFSMARVDTLRIQVQVPQTYYQAVKAGTKVAITVNELPGRTFDGTIYQNAGAIDPATRTMLTEVRVANHDNTLIPGMYAHVKFATGGNSKTLRVPANTVLINGQGAEVVAVEPDSTLKFIPIQTGRDFGTELEVVGGLRGNEQLVTNPTDDLKPNQKVKVLPAKEDVKK